MTNEQLVLCIQSGENEAENMASLYRQMSGMIAKIAMEYRGQEELDDLKQEGFIGLCNAVRAYRPEEGVPFHQYAPYWIRQGIRRHLENCGHLVRIPSGQAGLLQKYRRLCSEFLLEFGRRPSDREAMYCLELSYVRLRRLQQDGLMEKIGSLDVPVGEEEDTTLGELQRGSEGFEDSVIEEMNQRELKTALWAVVDTLEERQRQAIRLRYKEGCTFAETGSQMGITLEAARQWVDKGLRELRKPSRSNGLRPYLDGWCYSVGMRGTGAGVFKRTWTSATERAALQLAQ